MSDAINARPINDRPHTVPPAPGTYQFVVRRRDRFPHHLQRVVVARRHGPAYSRDLTTPWDGVRASTLFLRDKTELMLAKGVGWRDDITKKWMASLEGGEAAPNTPEAPELPKTAAREAKPTTALTLKAIHAAPYRELQQMAKSVGISGKQPKSKIREQLVELIGGGS